MWTWCTRSSELSEQAKRLRCGAEVVRDGAASVAVPVRQRLTRGGAAASPQGAELLDVAILGQVALGYSPFIDRNRAVAATRLTVFPLRPDAALDVAQLLHAVGDVWPAERRQASRSTSSARACSTTCCAPSPSANLMVEVPNFMASDPANVESLVRLHARRQHAAAQGPAERRAAARGAALLQVLDHRPRRRAPDRRGGARAGRRHPLDPARAVGRAHRAPTWRRRSPAAPTRCSAGRSTTRISGTAARTGKPVAQPDHAGRSSS